MTEKTINPIVKQILELGPPIAFFLVYLKIKDKVFTIGGTEYEGFIIAAAGFVPILLVSIGLLWHLTGKISRMQVFAAIMVVVFGGLTVYFNDEKFFKMKTTLVYGTFAAILGVGLLRKKSYLAYVMSDFLPMKKEGWMIFTRRLTAVFVLFAVVNEAVWRTMSTDFWVKFETFAMPAALMVFIMAQFYALQKYVIDEDEPKKQR